MLSVCEPGGHVKDRGNGQADQAEAPSVLPSMASTSKSGGTVMPCHVQVFELKQRLKQLSQVQAIGESQLWDTVDFCRIHAPMSMYE